MGAALAIEAAAAAPAQVRALILLSPAALPLSKPISASLGRFVLQLAQLQYPLAETTRSIAEVLTAPRHALRVALAVRSLDLTEELAGVRRAAIPSTVVACTTDTLVTTAHCHAVSHAIGARYHELTLNGGHMWMLTASSRLRTELTTATASLTR
jgi:pimeloyl-ACP methyl ester carboxylesterase